MILKLGSKGSEVKVLQEFLKVKADGDFGQGTKNAVLKYQKDNKLTQDGIVGDNTIKKMGLVFKSEPIVEKKKDSGYGDLKFITHMLDSDEYRHDIIIKPEYIFLHHTAGWDDPVAVVKCWNDDSLGRVSTEWVIGGESIKGRTANNGVIVKCMPDGSYSGHLGAVLSRHMHVNSIGIEMCNFGQLTLKNGKFYTYTNTEVDASQVCDLGFTHKGFKYYHKYSDVQIESTRQLVLKLSKMYNVDLKSGLQSFLKTQSPRDAFEYKEDTSKGLVKGLLTHGNVRRDKVDCSPQPNLVNMIKGL